MTYNKCIKLYSHNKEYLQIYFGPFILDLSLNFICKLCPNILIIPWFDIYRIIFIRCHMRMSILDILFCFRKKEYPIFKN